MDNKLFELCKEVYVATDWETERFYWSDNRNPDKYIESLRKLQIIDYRPKWLNGKDNEDKHVVPLYTSDYLLSKLPPSVYEGDNWIAVHNALGFDDLPIWSAEYTDGDEKAANDKFDKRLLKLIGTEDTPLKALLKLTLALHEAGELK